MHFKCKKISKLGKHKNKLIQYVGILFFSIFTYTEIAH